MSEPRTIPLTQGKVALVSPEDYDRVVLLGKWHAYPNYVTGTWYARRNGRYSNGVRGKQVTMHRFILDAPEGVEVDHRDRDGLNNVRANIRLATRSQNQCNRKIRAESQIGLKGVIGSGSGFRGWVTHEGERHYTRTFRTKEDAAHARDILAARLHGEFATINEGCYDASSVLTVRRKRRTNPDLPVGVIVGKYNYRAVIIFKGERFHIGTFRTPEEAHLSYVERYQQLYKKQFGGVTAS